MQQPHRTVVCHAANRRAPNVRTSRVLLVASVVVATALALPSLLPGSGTTAVPTSTIAQGTALSSSTGGSDWTMYMSSVTHTGIEAHESALSAATAPNLTELWNFTTGGRIVEQPVVVGGSVYIGSWDGNEYSVSLSNGSLQWKTYVGQTAGCGFTVPRGPASTAEDLNGTLYFTGGDGYFYALDAANGSVEWRTFLMNNSPTVGFYGWASAMIHNGAAYVGLASGCSNPNIVGGVAKIRLSNHTIVQRLDTAPPGTLGADVWGTPTWDPVTSSIFISTGNGPINNSLDEGQLQLNPKTLAIESNWTVPVALRVPDGDFGTTPVPVVTAKGVPLVVAANKDGILFAFNRTNLGLGPLWATRISTGPTFSSASFAKGMIFVGSTATTKGTQTINGSVRAIRPGTGKVLWETPMPGAVFGSISSANGLIATAGGDEIALLNATSGAVVWSYITNTTFQGAPSFAHGMLFEGGVDGTLFAFALPAGHGKGHTSGLASLLEPISLARELGLATRRVVSVL
ncbi:MAG: PQQ-binding-like beta-propeller repeat protein [Thermoplasmata archaeon]|nr:PQQ-binding-like beta-propeller repeat protein [Thermoplasmata archaeon]